ncbi:GGDEF domain-containing protein [Chloroflexota bacterium]
MADIKKQQNIDIDELVKGARDRDDLYRIIFEYNVDAIFVVDSSGVVVFLNASAERLFNIPSSQLIGQPFRFKNISDRPREVEIVNSENESRIAEIRWIETKLQDETLYIASLRDITEFIRLREELRAVAFVDELTGLFNRPGFFTLAQQQLKIASRGKSGMFLLIATVNDLARIRNNYGDSEGDKVIVEISNILKSTFRRSDIITRIDREEFAIMTLESFGASANVIASRLMGNLEDLNSKVVLPYKVSLSMGIAPFNPERPCTINELLADVDRALSESKRAKHSSALTWTFV